MKERIKFLRTQELQLTLEKFGERLGVGKTAISKLEKGENNVSDQMFKSICREFNVNPEWLRSGEGEMFNLPEDETAALVSELLEESNPTYNLVLNIIKTYRDLDEASQDILDDFILKLSQNMQKEKED